MGTSSVAFIVAWGVPVSVDAAVQVRSAGTCDREGSPSPMEIFQ